MFKLSTPVDRFRTVAFWEGVSFLVLLLIAMPLKYALGMPQAVRVVGMAHGLLFCAYVLTLLTATIDQRWGFKRVTLYFLASFVPAGTFWIEAQLKREAQVTPPLPAR